MSRSGLKGERLVALFLLGLVLFDPPLTGLFGISATVLGVPLLFAYIFGAWALLILLAALVVEGHAGRTGGGPPFAARSDG